MKQKLRNLSFLLVKIIVIILIFTIINKYIFGFHIAKETNMKPSINPSDLLIFYKINNIINTNDIVYIDNKIYRVVGTYEDSIKIYNKRLFINDEEYLIVGKEGENIYLKKYELLLIDNNDYYVVSRNKIKGKLIFRLQIRGF